MQVTVLNPLNQWLTIFKAFSARMKALEHRRLGMCLASGCYAVQHYGIDCSMDFMQQIQG